MHFYYGSIIICAYNLVYITSELSDLIKARQYNNPEHLFPMKKELLRWDSNPRHTCTAYEANALPTELPRQLSWLGRIKATQGQPVEPNLINRRTQTYVWTFIVEVLVYNLV